MKVIDPSQKIYLSKSTLPSGGRGVFAAKDIVSGELIESCPVISVHKNDVGVLARTILVNYYFSWGKGWEELAICLGFGSLYNHSYTPNAKYVKHVELDTIDFIALYNIKKDEEITVNYNGDPDSKKPIWMKDVPKE